MNRYLPLILVGVLLNAGAQIALKQGMRDIGPFAFLLENLFPIGMKIILNPFVVLGLLCYVISVVVWLAVLSKVEVSYAYPLLSVGYIVVAFAGKALFGESLGAERWIGVFIICVGVYLITRNA